MCAEQPEVMGLTFDYIQHLSLPNIPVEEIYNFRQLWVYALEIYNLKSNTGHTFLDDYVTKHIPAEITELHLFSDGCSG